MTESINYPVQECCGACKYWVRNTEPESKEGLCRRYPPKHVLLPSPIAQGLGLQAAILFPGMMEFNWCGEFRPRNLV